MHDANDARSPDATDERNEGPAPAVSVIVPAYNTARYIEECLVSVFAQTFADYEVVVVNDGSPDTEELERVLAPYRPRIRYIVQANRGLSGARNTGLRAARGTYVALLDSDDAWEPDYLELQVARMRQDPGLAVLYCDAHLFGEGVPAGRRFSDQSPSSGPVTLETLLLQRCCVMVSVLARRDVVVRLGGFDETLRSSEDFDLWLRIAGAGERIAYQDRPLVRYRSRPDGLSANLISMCHHILVVLGKVEREQTLTDAERQALHGMQRRIEATLALAEGKRALVAGDMAAARRFLTDANGVLRSRKVDAALWCLRVAPGVLRRIVRARAPGRPVAAEGSSG